jgi:hypothetical protein
MYWIDNAVSKHGRRRQTGRHIGALFDFRRRQTEIPMGGLFLVMVACVVCGCLLGRSVCRLLQLGG